MMRPILIVPSASAVDDMATAKLKPRASAVAVFFNIDEFLPKGPNGGPPQAAAALAMYCIHDLTASKLPALTLSSGRPRRRNGPEHARYRGKYVLQDQRREAGRRLLGRIPIRMYTPLSTPSHATEPWPGPRGTEPRRRRHLMKRDPCRSFNCFP